MRLFSAASARLEVVSALDAVSAGERRRDAVLESSILAFMVGVCNVEEELICPELNACMNENSG